MSSTNASVFEFLGEILSLISPHFDSKSSEIPSVSTENHEFVPQPIREAKAAIFNKNTFSCTK